MTSQHDGNEPSSPAGDPPEKERTQGAPGPAGDPSADGRTTAKEKTAELKEHTIARARQAGAQVREKAGHATELAKSKTPEPLLSTATHTAAHVRDTAAHVRDSASRAGHLAADKTPDAVRERAYQAAHAAGSKWTPVLSAGLALLIFLLVRHSRRNR
ncbi:DUF3618 domain-containing protein [Streptomyces sp. NPDC054961]